MRTLGSSVMSIGFTILLLSVSAGIHFGAGGDSLLVCFMGVLAGAILVAAGVRVAEADYPMPTLPAAFGSELALAAFVRRNTAAVGLIVASCAVTVVSGEEDLMLCFGMFALDLLAVSLISSGARRE